MIKTFCGLTHRDESGITSAPWWRRDTVIICAALREGDATSMRTIRVRALDSTFEPEEALDFPYPPEEGRVLATTTWDERVRRSIRATPVVDANQRGRNNSAGLSAGGNHDKRFLRRAPVPRA